MWELADILAFVSDRCKLVGGGTDRMAPGLTFKLINELLLTLHVMLSI